jgi:hypothetical protein
MAKVIPVKAGRERQSAVGVVEFLREAGGGCTSVA